MTDEEREAAEIEQARLERLKAESNKKIVRIKKRQNQRSLEREQEAERKKLTRDSRENNNRNVSVNRRKKKVAPGRKSTKKKVPKKVALVRAARKAAHNEVVRLLKPPVPSVAAGIGVFLRYLGERMGHPDISGGGDWLDAIESEVEQLRYTLRVERLIPIE